MKRADLIRVIKRKGCILIRHGANHAWYQNPENKASQPIPCHREVKESLARHIIKILTE